MTDKMIWMKCELEKIKEADYRLDEHKKYMLYTEHMLEMIGTLDSYIRDDLIYLVLNHWIFDGVYTSDQLRYIMNICMDDKHLFYQIQENQPDSVYTRTFSALILASLAGYHIEEPYLTYSELQIILKQMIRYYELETDLRGYTGEYGWAHSAAHGADVFEALARCNELTKADKNEILQVFPKKVCQGEYVFIDREPDRMAAAVMHVIKQNQFSNGELMEWMESFQNGETDQSSVEFFHERVNIECFFRTLYFHVKKLNHRLELLEFIEEKAGCK